MLKLFVRLQLLDVSEPHRLAGNSFNFLSETNDLGFVKWISMVREQQAKYDILPSDNVSAIKSKVRCFLESQTLSFSIIIYCTTKTLYLCSDKISFQIGNIFRV